MSGQRKNAACGMLFSLLLAPGLALGQSLDFTGAGARAMGIGGAFVGVADDATAIYWNPAGLTQLKKPEISVMGSYQRTSYDFSQASFDPKWEADSSASLNFASLVVPLSPGGANIVLGAGRVRALGYSYTDVDLSTNKKLTAKAALNNTMISAAYEFGKVVSLGFTGHLVDGGSHFEVEQGYYGSAASTYESKYKGKAFMTYGLLAKLGPPLRVGAFMRQHLSYVETDDSGYASSSVYPGEWGFGASARAGDNFSASVDMVTSRSSKAVDNGMPRQEQLISTGAYTGPADDLQKFRVGLEYLLTGKGMPLPIRVGTFSVPENLHDADNKRVKTRYFTGGVGLLGQSLQMDLAFLYGTRNYKTAADDLRVDRTLEVIGSIIFKFK